MPLVKRAKVPVVNTQWTDLGDLKVEIGMSVEMVTRRIRQDGFEGGMTACIPQGYLWVQAQACVMVRAF